MEVSLELAAQKACVRRTVVMKDQYLIKNYNIQRAEAKNTVLSGYSEMFFLNREFHGYK
jgi:hypothetical protein